MLSIDVDILPGVRLRVRHWPGGPGIPFLLVHGLSSNARLWDEVAPHLVAAGHSACFGSAIVIAASLSKIPLRPRDVKVTAIVNLNKDESGGAFLDETLNAELNGVSQAQAEALVAKAHTLCPYSKATRGNIEVRLQANGKDVMDDFEQPDDDEEAAPRTTTV